MVEQKRAKILNPNPRCWAAGEAAWQLFGSRELPKASQLPESSLCQCRPGLFHLYWQKSYRYQRTLASPALNFLYLSALITAIFLLIDSFSDMWFVHAWWHYVPVWERATVLPCNLMGDNVRNFICIFTIAFSLCIRQYLLSKLWVEWERKGYWVR